MVDLDRAVDAIDADTVNDQREIIDEEIEAAGQFPVGSTDIPFQGDAPAEFADGLGQRRREFVHR